MSKWVGTLWNNSDIEIWEIDGRMFALYGWNGEDYCDSWEVSDKDGFDAIDPDTTYRIRPITEEIDEDEWEIVGMDLR